MPHPRMPVACRSSVGRQLTDRDAAYRQGIITEKEYMKLRKAIISKND